MEGTKKNKNRMDRVLFCSIIALFKKKLSEIVNNKKSNCSRTDSDCFLSAIWVLSLFRVTILRSRSDENLFQILKYLLKICKTFNTSCISTKLQNIFFIDLIKLLNFLTILNHLIFDVFSESPYWMVPIYVYIDKVFLQVVCKVVRAFFLGKVIFMFCCGFLNV